MADWTQDTRGLWKTGGTSCACDEVIGQFNIKTVVCGSSSTDVATYTDWERIVLEYTYDFADYISLHQYYGGQEMGTDEFLPSR